MENVLAAHPDITDVAVVGRCHPDYGQSIVAVITTRAGTTVTPEGVKVFCADRIAHYKIPYDLVIGTIPPNPSGKILKHQLRHSVQAADAATR
jgi:acyl-CoA synthetase (AMP-forming)/AMP-acid ligase II